MIDISKKYKTRDGRDVRLYAVDGETQWPIHGAIMDKDGWLSASWKFEGMYRKDRMPCSEDLIEVKPERWYPIYAKPDGDYFMKPGSWPTRDAAMKIESAAYGFPVDAWKAPT